MLQSCKKSNDKLIGYIDATGRLVRSHNEIGNKIFYYALIIPIRVYENESTDPFPVTDLISANHNFETLGNWLRSFKIFINHRTAIWPIFHTVVRDFSFARFNSVLESFNNLNIVQYL